LTGFGRRFRDALGSDHKSIDAVRLIEDTFISRFRFAFGEISGFDDG
jgi:hypothetical protein